MIISTATELVQHSLVSETRFRMHSLTFLSSEAEVSTLCFSSPSVPGHESRHIAVLTSRWLMIVLGLEIRTIQ